MLNGITRFYSVAIENDEVPEYLNESKKIIKLASLTAACILLITLVLLYLLGCKEWIKLSATAIIYSIFSSYNAIIIGVQNAARQRKSASFYITADVFVKIFFTIIFSKAFGASSSVILISFTFGSMLITLVQYILLDKNIKLKIKNTNYQKDWGNKIWNYSLPFCSWGIFSWIQQSSDRWALQTFAKPHEVGDYAVLYQIGFSPIILATSVFVSFLAPVLYEKSGDASDPMRNNLVHNISWSTTKISLFFTIIAFVTALELHRWLFSVFFPPDYQAFSYLFPWVVMAGGFFAAGQIIALKMMSEMRTSEITVIKIVTSIIGIILNILGAKLLGIRGVVAALVLFTIFYFIWIASYCKNAKQS